MFKQHTSEYNVTFFTDGLGFSNQSMCFIKAAPKAFDPTQLREHFGPIDVIDLRRKGGAQPPFGRIEIGEVPERTQPIGAHARVTADHSTEGGAGRGRLRELLG